MKLTLEQLNKTINWFNKLSKKELNRKYYAYEYEYEYEYDLYCRMFGKENVIKIQSIK